MTAQERSDDIRRRVRADMVTTLRIHLGKAFAPTGEMLDDLAENAMHHVDKLLAESFKAEGGNMTTCNFCGNTGFLIKTPSRSGYPWD